MMENRDTILLYLNAAHEELRASRHNINGGYYGVKVFELRQAADYDTLITTEREQAVATLESAQAFVTRMRDFIQAEGYDV